MLTFEQLLQLAQLPVAALLVILVALIIVGAIREWWVPGAAFRRELKRNDTLDAQMTALTKTVEAGFDDVAWNATNRRPRARRDG